MIFVAVRLLIALLLEPACAPMIGGHCYYNADAGDDLPCGW